MEKRIKIFASYHAEALRIKNDVFEPIQIGRDVFGYTLDGMLSENTGDNISHKQPIYSDLVTSYWLLKNYIDTCDEDYIGVCHYRRAFSFKRPMTWRNIKEKIKCHAGVYLMPFVKIGSNLADWNAHFIYDSEEFLNSVNAFTLNIKKDIQHGKHQIYGIYPLKYSNYTFGIHYERHITTTILDLVEEILNIKYPDFAETFRESRSSNKLYYGNVFIMQKDRFREYTTMLFDVLEEHQKLCVERGIMIDPIKEKFFARGEGYIAELMTSTFVRHYLKKDNNIVKLLYATLYNVLPKNNPL